MGISSPIGLGLYVSSFKTGNFHPFLLFSKKNPGKNYNAKNRGNHYSKMEMQGIPHPM